VLIHILVLCIRFVLIRVEVALTALATTAVVIVIRVRGFNLFVVMLTTPIAFVFNLFVVMLTTPIAFVF
jgi:hypothetical protein